MCCSGLFAAACCSGVLQRSVRSCLLQRSVRSCLFADAKSLHKFESRPTDATSITHLYFRPFTAAHACPSIAAAHVRPSLRFADALASTGLGCDRRVCEAQLVKITGQTKNMKKTVLVQNDTLEWGATCFPRKAFRLIFGTNTVGLQYKIELVLVLGRLLWYRTKMCPIRNVTQQGALARNCPSKALQVRLHPDIKT